jgi:3-oxoacyl-[acyl-carrier-protein] synthase II
MNGSPRVVVTGYGTVCSASGQAEGDDFLAELEAVARRFPDGAGRQRTVPDFQAGPLIDEAALRRMDRFTQLSLVATLKALSRAGLAADAECRERVGLVFNTVFAHFDSTRSYMTKLIRDGVKKVSAAVFPNTVHNAFSGLITMELKVYGSNSTVTGYNPIAYGVDLIRSRRDEAVIVGGSDELIPAVAAAFGSPDFLGAAPPFALGEGAGVLILESEEFARRRGAVPLAEVLDYGTSYAPGTLRQPFTADPAAVERAMRQALERSEVEAAQVDVLSACANGHAALDAAENEALRGLFGGSRPPAVASVKAILGETFGASSVLSGVLGVALLQRQAIPACVDVTPTFFSGATRATDTADHVAVNSVELGGTCTSIVLKRYQER